MKQQEKNTRDFIPELVTYEKIFAGICGYGVRCVQITQGDELGYTTPDRTIYLAYWHDIMTGISSEKRVIFRQGVFVHEMLHQIFTDFNAEDKFLEEKGFMLNYGERKIYHDISNILEDPAIEYFAPQEIGSRLLKSLRFMIAWVWRKSPPIDKTEDPFGQFINAFIQIGDMGLFKGRFTDSRAKEAYCKALPYFNAGVVEPLPSKRAEYAYEVFEASRPLWEERLAEMEALLQMLSDIMMVAGKSAASSTESSGKNGIAVIPDAGSSDSASEEKQSNREKSAQDVSGHTDDRSTDISDEMTTVDASQAQGTEDPCEKYDVSSDDIKEALAEISSSIGKEKKKSSKKEQEKDTSPIPDFDIKGSFESVSCINKRIDVTEAACKKYEYDRIVSEHRGTINACVKYLQELFRDSLDDTVRHTSGKYNIIRAETASSARIFDKRRIPDNTKPAVMIVIDKSGSTSGEKIKTEQETAIILAEIFGKLDIPLYIMSFYVNLRNNVVHEHYITWKNNRTTRLGLMKLSSAGCNLDGYSIRYAGKILQKRPENKKIMFILSDGTPSCSIYETRENGIKDTTNAIREARRICDVCGFGVGSGLETMQQMYGNGFIMVDELDKLTSVLIKKLKQII